MVMVDVIVLVLVGRTPLHLCASRGHVECCDSLITQGATILVHDAVNKSTPIHSAGELALLLSSIVCREFVLACMRFACDC